MDTNSSLVDTLAISEIEYNLLEDAVNGKMFDANNNTINAKFISYLYHGYPIKYNRVVSNNIKIKSVSIKNAIIIGFLNLEEICGEYNGFAPSLKFENCEFINNTNGCDINLSKAKISFLSFKNCHFKYLKANGIDIDGPLYLTGISASEGSEICQVEMKMARIRGDINAENSHFYSTDEPKDREQEYAWYMRGLELHGRVIFNDGTANGGISLQDANIQGDVWLINCHILNKKDEEKALNLQSSYIKGLLEINNDKKKGKESTDSDSIEEIIMLETVIDGSIEIKNTKIKSFLANNLSLGGYLIVDEVTVENSLEIINSKIDNHLSILNTTIINKLCLTYLDIKGNLELYAQENIIKIADLKYNYISGSLLVNSIMTNIFDLSYSKIENNVNIEDSSIKTSLYMSAIYVDGNAKLKNVDLKKINCTNANIKKDFELDLKLSESSSFEKTIIGGDLILNNIIYEIKESKNHILSFSNMEILKRLEIDNIILEYKKKTFLSENDENFKISSEDLPFYKTKNCNYKLIQLINISEDKVIYIISEPNDGKKEKLNGDSSIIHEINDKRVLDLSSDELVREYLRFFCNHVWGDEGAFKIIEDFNDVEITTKQKNDYQKWKNNPEHYKKGTEKKLLENLDKLSDKIKEINITKTNDKINLKLTLLFVMVLGTLKQNLL